MLIAHSCAKKLNHGWVLILFLLPCNVRQLVQVFLWLVRKPSRRKYSCCMKSNYFSILLQLPCPPPGSRYQNLKIFSSYYTPDLLVADSQTQDLSAPTWKHVPQLFASSQTLPPLASSFSPPAPPSPPSLFFPSLPAASQDPECCR